MMKKDIERTPAEEPELSQEAVERLMKARTMEEYLAIAAEEGIDWDALDDEWLEAIVSGDVSELLWRQERRRRQARKAKHAEGI